MSVIATLLMALVPVNAQDAADNPPDKALLAFSARLAADATRARMVIDFVSEARFKIRYLDGPARIVVDLPLTNFGFKPETLKARGLVQNIRYGNAGQGRSRIILEFAGPVSLEVAEMEPMEGGGGFRFVLDAVTAPADVFAELVAETDWVNSSKGPRAGKEPSAADTPFVVVVDPGHGGIDGGAEGVKGTKEKAVTLAFGKDLADALNELDDIKVILTRKDDSFISLSGRLRMAHEAAADLFVSLHADSIRIRRLRGATVYTLSDKASDAVAASLATRDNGNDSMIGGEIEQAPESVAGILVDMARSETQVFSSGLAEQIVRNFEGEILLINNPHRQAGFRVLQSPDLPAALVELGYLSNPQDEKLLIDPEWRAKAAELLAASIESYRKTILAAGE